MAELRGCYLRLVDETKPAHVTFAQVLKEHEINQLLKNVTGWAGNKRLRRRRVTVIPHSRDDVAFTGEEEKGMHYLFGDKRWQHLT